MRCCKAVLLVALYSLAVAAGCAGNAGDRFVGNVEPTQREAAAQRDAVARKPIAYVGDEGRSVIAVFDNAGREIGKITKGLKYPEGIVVDREHNLWVANAGKSNVVEYAQGATSPMLTLPDGASNAPQDVGVCRDGTILVANIIGGVARYVGAKHHVASSLEYEGASFTNVMCDAAGNVFATAVVGTSGNVIAFPHGQQYGAHSLPIFSSGNLGGIKPDKSGNILVSDIAGHVTEYTEQGYPTGVRIDTPDRWVDIALDKTGKLLLCGDETKNEGVVVTFPGGAVRGAYKDHFSKVLGVAFDS